jgi:hypothetical protein
MTMARKALLIGSQTGGLSGVENDIESMAAVLDRWGFASTRCVAANACRAGILDEYERLIADAGPDDAVVIYYSGHGGYGRRRDPDGNPRPAMARQFIVPTDFDESSEGDFRGIMSAELSILLARLTERTKNVTVALDCCHAAHMCRGDERQLVVKAQPRPVPYSVLVHHFEGLRQQGEHFDRWQPPSNPWAVRIVACAPEQSAYEYSNADGIRTGMLTDALVEALTYAHSGGLRVSWSRVVERVRQRVLTYLPAQRPEAEGPAHRLIFETAEVDSVASLPVLVSGDRVSLEGASLVGVQVDDEFAIMPPDSTGLDDAAKLGDVVIDEVHAMAAGGVLRVCKPDAPVPLGARAYQTKAAAPAMPVRLPGDGRGSAALTKEVAGSPILRSAEPDEPCSVKVESGDAGELTIWDRAGPLHPPRVADEAGVEHIMRNLKRLAWASSLRRLADDPAHALDTPVEVEFGLVNGGEAEPLPTSGAILYLGQRIYIRVRNRGEKRIYVSLVDIGVSSQVTILNTASPAGEAVDPGATYTFGWNDLKGVLQGSKVTWPAGLVQATPRPETVIILATSQPQNIRGLEQPGVRDAPSWDARFVEGQPRSALERVLDQIDHGGMRDLTPEEGSSVRYTVRAVEFELVPEPPPVAEEPEFQVDERPESSVLLWSPKSAVPTTVAVRLTDLVVHHNRAFRSADIRLDTIVLTRGADGQPVHAAQTERFSNVRDGDAIPLDKTLVYHGPVVDYLDIAVWVSRDASGSLALGDLMQEKLTRPDVQIAMGQVTAVLVGAPQAAIAVAAIGASAVLINTAYHLLSRTLGNSSIGLYRTTILASERFGIGRPADQCAVRAQDFSFRYLIEDAS